jgi:hypothetical protein
MRSTELGCSRSFSCCLWTALDEEGCMGLVPCHSDLWCKSSWILDDSSLKIKLNQSWKVRRIGNVSLVLMERSWWAGFNRICLVRFGFRMWERLNFKWFLPLKIQINSKKPGFWKEKSVEDVVTLGPTALLTLVSNSIKKQVEPLCPDHCCSLTTRIVAHLFMYTQTGTWAHLQP